MRLKVLLETTGGTGGTRASIGQFFHQYQYDMDIVQSVLGGNGCLYFNKPEQFSILIPFATEDWYT